MKNIKKPLYSALVFFGTLIVLSLGYAWNNAMTQVGTGSGLTANSWNAMVDNINDLNSRSWGQNGLASYYTTGNVGIGTNAPGGILEITGNGAKEVILNDTDGGGGGDMSLVLSNNGTKKYYMRNKDGLDFEISRYGISGDFSLKNGNVGINTLNPISIGGYGRSLNIAANAGPTLVLQDPDTTSGYRVGYFSYIDGVLTYGRAADDGSNPSPRFTVSGNNQFYINSLAANYTGGSAFLCIYSNGQIYASEAQCP